MKTPLLVLLTLLVLIPLGTSAARACTEYIDGPPCEEPTYEDEIVLDFEEETSGSGGVTTNAWFDCMDSCSSRFGSMRYYRNTWWGLDSCTYYSGTFYRRVNCYYSR